MVTRIRAFYIYVVLFALGAFAAQLTPVTIPAWLAASAGVGLTPCWFLSALRPCACLAAGVLWALFRADLVLQTEWPEALERRDVVLLGTIASLPERGERYMKFDLDVERARFKGEPVVFAGRVRLRWYDPPRRVRDGLKAASTWRLKVRLKQPHGYYNPGGFDYEAYLFRERVRATGYVRESGVNEKTGESHRSFLLSARQSLRDRLEASMEGLRHPGLLKALALGDRSAVSDEAWQTLRATGTNHLIAISGLHIGFVAGIGALLGLWAGRVITIFKDTVSAPRTGALSALGFALCYAALSGFAVPAQRAFVMAAVFLLGVFCRRHAWTVRGLCVALVIVLVLNPASVHDPGFWLSFCAVALIISWLARVGTRGKSGEETGEAAGGLIRKGETKYRLGGGILAAAKLQWVLSVALLPLVAAFFGVASLAAAPANSIAVPVVVFGLVPLCLASVALTAFGLHGAAAWCLAAADAVMDVLWGILEWLGGLDYARVEAHLELWQALVLLGGAVWVILARPGRRKWGLAGAAVLLAPGPAAPGHGEFQVAVLDVGQGLSAVVRTAHHTLVYDTGPRYPSGFSLAEAVVIPYLRARAVDRIDVMVVSHGDNDHRGGFEDLYSRYPVRTVLSSVAGDLPGAGHCVQGQHWEWDGVTFDVLHPRDANVPPHNNASCVLRITGRYGSMLLTGDIETEAEEALVRRWGAGLRSDVLLVPHHGGDTSSTPSFVDHVDPGWAVVSAGYLNRYEHPRPAILMRYRRRGITVINTARAGAVIVDVSRDGIRLSEWRESRPRFWLDRSDPAHGRDAI